MLKVEFLRELKSQLADIAEINDIALFVLDESKLVVCSAAFDSVLMLKVLGTTNFPSIDPTHPMWQRKGKSPEEMAEIFEAPETWRGFLNALSRKLEGIIFQQRPAAEPIDDVWQRVVQRHELSVGLAVDGSFLACESNRIKPVEVIGPHSLIALLQEAQVAANLEHLKHLQGYLDICSPNAATSTLARQEVLRLEKEMGETRAELAGFLCMGGHP